MTWFWFLGIAVAVLLLIVLCAVLLTRHLTKWPKDLNL